MPPQRDPSPKYPDPPDPSPENPQSVYYPQTTLQWRHSAAGNSPHPSSPTVCVVPRSVLAMASSSTSDVILVSIPSSRDEEQPELSFNNVPPPPHTRPLPIYIPDCRGSPYNSAISSRSDSTRSSPWNTPSHYASFLNNTPPLQLHPALLSPDSLQMTFPARSYWAPLRHAPATSPVVRTLDILIQYTSDTITVQPSTRQNPHVVTVEDVLWALGSRFSVAGHGLNDHDLFSAVMNLFQLWFRDERAPGSRQFWQLVVGRR